MLLCTPSTRTWASTRLCATPSSTVSVGRTNASPGRVRARRRDPATVIYLDPLPLPPPPPPAHSNSTPAFLVTCLFPLLQLPSEEVREKFPSVSVAWTLEMRRLLEGLSFPQCQRRAWAVQAGMDGYSRGTVGFISLFFSFFFLSLPTWDAGIGGLH